MSRNFGLSFSSKQGIVLLAIFVSGGASLAYEVCWSRMLTVLLGNSGDATAVVLASFMFGIAVGARTWGQLADRVRVPLKLYVALEIGLGLFAFVAPPLIRLMGSLTFLQGGFDEFGLATLLRYAGSFIVVALPSLAMGATIPVLVRALTATPEDLRRRIGLIYGTNTVGAATGAALTGFIAIPSLGLSLTSAMAGGASILAGLLVLGVVRLGDAADTAAPTATPASPPPARGIAIAALVAAGTSGFIVLAVEVLWARLLTFVFGHDTYAFAILLGVVLLGLGLGGLLYRTLTKTDPVLTAGVLIGLLAVSLLGSFWIAGALVVSLGRDPFAVAQMSGLTTSLWVEFIRELLFTPILVLVPAVLAGAAFPAVCAVYCGSSDQPGRRVGTAVLVNGVGAAAGALIAGLGLVAWLGLQYSFLLLTALGILSSLALILAPKPSVRRATIIPLAGPLIAASVLAALMPSNLPRDMLQNVVGQRHQRILFYEEGKTGTVSVTENVINGEKQLFMNAVNEVTTRLVHDQSFKLLGHLGPLLHQRPRTGVMICLGAGLSAGAALQHPLASLDVVELSSTIPRAARLFAAENRGALDDPRLRLHIGDGRQFLQVTPQKYDVAMVDSTHPKAVDSWILYTREFYELMRARLTDTGIAVQWVPLHGLSERELKIIVRTFWSIFPQTTLWVNVGFETYGQAGYLKMVGTQEPLLIDYRELSARLKEPRIKKDLAPFGMDAVEEILDGFLAGPAMVAAWTADLPLQTDDRPIVPYITSYTAGRRMSSPLLLGVRSSVVPLLRRMGSGEAAIRDQLKQAFDAQGFLLAGALPRATEIWPTGKKIKLFNSRAAQGAPYYQRLAELYEDDAEKLFEIGNYLGNLQLPDEARALYEKSLQQKPGDPRVLLNQALTLLDLGRTDTAVKLLNRIIKQTPEHPLAQFNLGVALLANRDTTAAIAHLRRAIELNPELIGARLSLAQAHLDLGQLQAAELELTEVIDRNRWIAEAWDMLGLIAGQRGDWNLARRHHLHALGLEPYRAEAHYNLGIALQESGRLKEAALAYHAALKIQPKDAEAHNNLGLVYAAAGLHEEAALAFTQALDIEPHYPEAAFNLGLAKRAAGHLQAAVEAFTLALTLAPDLQVARQELAKLVPDNPVSTTTDPTGDAGP